MSSKRPYLIKAMYDWMIDNEKTPHIVVNTSVGHNNVPKEHIKDGKVILNIGTKASWNLIINNDTVSFGARFGGVPHDIVVPTESVLGIYDKETGKGMIFGEPETPEHPEDEPKPAKVPHLRLVVNNDES